MNTASATPRWLTRKTVLLVMLIVALVVLPIAIPDPNFVRLLFVTLIWAAAGAAWNLLGGFAGQVSFGFAVFYGTGAYTTALLMNEGVNPLLAFVASAVSATLVSLVVGVPTLRLRGPYFAIATIGVSEAVRVVSTNLGFTGGASGYRIVEHRAFHQLEHYFSALGVAALAVIVSVMVARSKFGLGLRAIRQDEDAAADVGVSPFPYKLAAHGVGAALTGMAGGVAARYAAFIHPQGVFGFETSVHILLIPVIGGIGTIWGPVLGAVVFGIVEEELIASFPEIHLLLYGSLLILIMVAEPGGLLGAASGAMRRLRERRKRGANDPGSQRTDKVLWWARRGQRR